MSWRPVGPQTGRVMSIFQKRLIPSKRREPCAPWGTVRATAKTLRTLQSLSGCTHASGGCSALTRPRRQTPSRTHLTERSRALSPRSPVFTTIPIMSQQWTEWGLHLPSPPRPGARDGEGKGYSRRFWSDLDGSPIGSRRPLSEKMPSSLPDFHRLRPAPHPCFLLRFCVHAIILHQVPSALCFVLVTKYSTWARP